MVSRNRITFAAGLLTLAILLALIVMDALERFTVDLRPAAITALGMIVLGLLAARQSADADAPSPRSVLAGALTGAAERLDDDEDRQE